VRRRQINDRTALAKTLEKVQPTWPGGAELLDMGRDAQGTGQQLNSAAIELLYRRKAGGMR